MNKIKTIKPYNDEQHAEENTGIRTDENGYKFRLLEGLVVPPYVTPERYRLSRTFESRQGDVCYVSYPKSGSTWLAYIILLLTRNGEIPDEGTLRSNIHWVESSWTYPRELEYLRAQQSPRIFKSHMPYYMAFGGDPLSKPCKYVYIARNPKDVATSYYFFETNKAWSGYFSCTWDLWLKMFIDGKVQRGDWFDHVLGWWKKADNQNILFLKYEDLLSDYINQISSLARFLGYDISDEMLKSIEVNTSFNKMKGNNFSNMCEIEDFKGFFRKGKIGSWKKQFSKKQADMFDLLIEKRLGGTGLEFTYE